MTLLLKAALVGMFLQPALAAPQAAKASVAGVVVGANGEPLSNIRVSLGKLNVSLGAFTQMVTGSHPPKEVTISIDAFAAISDEIENEIANGGISADELPNAAAFKSVPIDEIFEVTVSPSGATAVVFRTLPPVMTDANGRFAFEAVDPGTYQLMFSAPGYAKQNYGQRAVGTGGVPLTFVAGQNKTDIVMRMMAVSAVGGRIRDNTGLPAAGVPVSLFRFSYDETGKKKTDRIASTRTDDLGEYRMYYLSPGRYYLSAGNQGSNTLYSTATGIDAIYFGGGYASQNMIPRNFTLTYYPGVADESGARPIDVQPGVDVRGVDLVVSPQQTYRVRGRVVDSKTGQPPPGASITMNLATTDLNSFVGSNIGAANYKAADGSFELQNVSTGAYIINASLPPTAQQRAVDYSALSPSERTEYIQSMQAENLARPKASLPVTVVNSDIDGVVLTLGVSGFISGRVRFESNAPTKPEAISFIRFQLRGGPASSPLNGGGAQARPVKPDGTFRVENVWPGDYVLAVAGLPEGFYVKEARLGNTDILNGPLHYTTQDNAVMDILLSPAVARVEGMAVDANGQPMAGAQVVLIPTKNRERTDLFRPATSDSAGHFTLVDISPGDYTLAAWESLEPFAFFDPNLIAQAEASGKNVRVGESSAQAVSVNVMR